MFPLYISLVCILFKTSTILHITLFLFYMLLRRHSRKRVRYGSIIIQSKETSSFILLVLINRNILNQGMLLAFLLLCCIENISNCNIAVSN